MKLAYALFPAHFKIDYDRHKTQVVWAKLFFARAKRALRPISIFSILAVTIVYAVVNIPLTLYLILQDIDYNTNYKYNLLGWDMPYYYAGNFAEIYGIAMNASLNPLVYIMSISDMRIVVFGWYQRLLSNISNIFTESVSRRFLYKS